MMEFAHVAVAVFSLLSLGHSAPVTSCENLIQSREIQRNQLLGKWTYIAESTDMFGSNMLTKMFMDSVWFKVTTADETDTLNNFYHQKMLGMCFTLKTNMTLVNNTLTMVGPFQTSSILLNTGCPDCLVLYSQNMLGRTTAKGLQLLSRRIKVSAAELEEFTKQAQCLNLTSPVVMDSEKGFCPDPALTPETKTIDLTSTMDSISSDDVNLLGKLFRSDSGVKTLADMIQSSVAQFKGN